jgi:hypothetical protein
MLKRHTSVLVGCLLAVCVVAVLTGSPMAAVEYGLAARYPGDAGIESDPSVIFTENFEEASVSELVARWEDALRPDRMSFTTDTPAASGGSQSVSFTGSAHLYRRLLPGYDRLYVRFYAKFDPTCNQVHHFVWMGGHNPSTSYPWPRAGQRPAGDERWSTGIEPMGANWAWDFYTYWMRMRPDGRGDYWGNFLSGNPSPHSVARAEWIAVEFMVKLNDPVDSYNGEQAFWINGERKAHLGRGFPNGTWRGGIFTPHPNGTAFEGFQWRIDQALNINYLWLENYVDTDPGCRVWFDDVVVATQYIGPTVTGSSSDGSSQVVQLKPVADTFININNSVASGQRTLNVYTWPDQQIANAILMKFDLSSIPAGAAIQDATLHLHLSQFDSTGDSTYTVTVHKVINKDPVMNRATGYRYDGVNAWTSNSCSYNNVPLAQADLSAPYATRTIAKTPGYQSWGVTAVVQEWVNTPATNFVLLLNSDPSKLRDRYRSFASLEEPDASKHPYLRITYAAPQQTYCAPAF